MTTLYNKSLPANLLVSRDATKDTFQKILRDAVIVDRIVTVSQLSQETGICEDTIRFYMRLGNPPMPDLDKALAIACVIGAKAVNALLALIGYGGAVPLDEPDQIKPCQVIPRAMPHLSRIAEIAEDGRVTNCEQPHWEASHTELVAIFISNSSIARAG